MMTFFSLWSTSQNHCVVFRNLTRYTMGKSEHFTMPKPRLYHITAQTAAGRGKKSHSNAIMWQFASVCIDLPIAQCWCTIEWSYFWKMIIFLNFCCMCLNPNYFFSIWNLGLKNLQKQAFCNTTTCFDVLMFKEIVLVISKRLQIQTRNFFHRRSKQISHTKY